MPRNQFQPLTEIEGRQLSFYLFSDPKWTWAECESGRTLRRHRAFPRRCDGMPYFSPQIYGTMHPIWEMVREAPPISASPWSGLYKNKPLPSKSLNGDLQTMLKVATKDYAYPCMTDVLILELLWQWPVSSGVTLTLAYAG
jgi:hypothetical protein